MRKKSDALSKAWETINTPLVAADSAMKDQADEEQKERKSLLLAIKRNSRERQARHIAKGMPIKSAQSKENTMSRTRGQSKTHTTGSIAREKQATHARISKLMDDLPKDKPSKGITVTKKTVSMKPVSKTKPVTLCGLKKKAETMNITPKQRIKLAQSLLKQAEKRAGIFGSLKQGSDKGQSTSSLLSQLALILGGGVIGGKMGGKAAPKVMKWLGRSAKGVTPARKVGSNLAGSPRVKTTFQSYTPDDLAQTSPHMWLHPPAHKPRSRRRPSLLGVGGVVGGGLAGGGAGYGLSEAIKQGSYDLATEKRFMLKVAASNLSPREKLAMAGLIGRGLAAGAKALPGVMRGARQAVRGAGRLAGQGLESAGRGVGTLGAAARMIPGPIAKAMGAGARGAGKAMQAGGRALQSAPGVAGGAGLAGIAAGRMSMPQGQPQQTGGKVLPTPPGLKQLPEDLNSSMGEMQKSLGGMSPAGTGLTGQPGAHTLRPEAMKNMQAGGPEMYRAARSMFNPVRNAFRGLQPFNPQNHPAYQPVRQQSRSDF